MNRIVPALAVALTLLLSVTPAATAEPDDLIQRQIDALPDDVDGLLRQLEVSWRDVLPDLSISGITARIRRREPPIDWNALIRTTGGHFLREVRAGTAVAAQLLAIGVLFGLVRAFGSSGSNDSPVRVAAMVCQLALARLAAGAFIVGLTTATGIVRDLVSTMLALMPALAALVAASGSYATAGLFHPFMMWAVHFTGRLAADFVLPVLMTAGVIELVGHIAPVHRLSGVSSLLRQIGMGALGLALCLVLGISAVLGAAGMASDGVTLRSLKFAAGAFIPVIGKMFGDAAELVLSSSLLVKNAVGIAGAATLLLTALLPLAKLVALGLTFRVTAAIAQPLGIEELASCVTGVANSIVQFALTAAAVAVMFFLAVAALIGASNASVMMR